MSLFSNPFDPGSRLACACGRHASQAEHARAEHAAADGGALDRAVEGAVMRALFPQDALLSLIHICGHSVVGGRHHRVQGLRLGHAGRDAGA